MDIKNFYICVQLTEVNAMSKLINSCLNYSGNKYKLLPQLLQHFPKEFNNFIDLFAGGAVVSVNVAQQYSLLNKKGRFILNDKEKAVINLFQYMKETKISTFIQLTEDLIKKYKLSDTKRNGYDYYGMDSANGLSKYNKEYYNNLKYDFNKKRFDGIKEAVAFYILIVFGFNNQIRFNKKGEYNLPAGKRDFNLNMERKLIIFMQQLQSYSFEFYTKDFREIRHYKKGDFIYADPPYRISTASYNENRGWGTQDDLDLFDYLDQVDNRGAKFALSNVLKHKGNTNTDLNKWSENYNVHILKANYNNSNYQSTAKDNKTVEVLITNY